MARAALGPDGRRWHPIWRHDEAGFELARLAAIVFSFDLRGQSGPESVQRFIDAVNGAAARDNPPLSGDDGYHKIYRFLNFQSLPDQAKILDMIAAYVGKRLQELAAKPDGVKTGQIKGRLDVLQAFTDHQAQKLKPGFPASYDGRGGGSIRRPTHLDIDEDQFEAASIYLTSHPRVAAGERLERAGFYACYRYSAHVGEISKNQFSILPCTDDDPVCRFANTFKDRNGNVRKSEGVVFKEAGWVYFVGRIDGDNGIKALTMSAVGRDKPALVQALVMSKAVEPIVSRAALERLDKEMLEKQIRVANERTDTEFSAPSFRSRIVPLIQNGVRFQNFDKIIYKPKDGKEREISQTRMVQMVPELLAGEFMLRDLQGKDSPFNPASHEHYPFNQAVKIGDG